MSLNGKKQGENLFEIDASVGIYIMFQQIALTNTSEFLLHIQINSFFISESLLLGNSLRSPFV